VLDIFNNQGITGSFIVIIQHRDAQEKAIVAHFSEMKQNKNSSGFLVCIKNSYLGKWYNNMGHLYIKNSTSGKHCSWNFPCVWALSIVSPPPLVPRESDTPSCAWPIKCCHNGAGSLWRHGLNSPLGSPGVFLHPSSFPCDRTSISRE